MTMTSAIDRGRVGRTPCLAAAVLLVAAGIVRAGEPPPPPPPKEVTQSMQAMQNLLGGGQGGAQGGGGEASLETIKKLLVKERNIKIWESRGRIFLEGRVTSKQIRDRIRKLTEIYGNLVDLTEYQPDMDTFLADMELIKEKIETTLNKNFTDKRAFVTKQEVAVNIINDKIVVSGELNTKDDIDKAVHIAKIYNDNVVNNLNVRKQMIEVAAIFAKTKKTDQDKMGTTGLQSAIVTLPVITAGATDSVPTRYPFDYFRSYRHTATEAAFSMGGETGMDMSFFNYFKKNAILARPHLASVNGQSSKFLGGGEKAIKTVTANASDVSYKEYGVILETTPSLTTDGRINLKIKLEFSVPEANGEDFVTFRHEGEAILSSGQGMVLSGLINEARSRGLTRTPFIGRVPILNFFFSQREDAEEAEDLVLITIPRVPGAVKQAPYPKTERTAKAAEDAFWIHKPDVPHRMLDRLKGKRGQYWMDGSEVLMDDEEEPGKKPEGKGAPVEEKADETDAGDMPDNDEEGGTPATKVPEKAEPAKEEPEEGAGTETGSLRDKNSDPSERSAEPEMAPEAAMPVEERATAEMVPMIGEEDRPPVRRPAAGDAAMRAMSREAVSHVVAPGLPVDEDETETADM